MRTHDILTAAYLASICQAQLKINSDLNVTISSAGARSCGQGSDADGNAFTIHTQAIPTHQVCLNFLDQLTYDILDLNGSLTQPPRLAADIANFTLLGTEHYNRAVNYTQVFYQQGPSATRPAFGAAQFEIYEGYNCVQAAKSTVPYDWTCTETDGKCSPVAINIRSISISPATYNRSSNDTGIQCRLAGGYVVSGGAGRSGKYLLKSLAGAAGVMLGVVLLV